MDIRKFFKRKADSESDAGPSHSRIQRSKIQEAAISEDPDNPSDAARAAKSPLGQRATRPSSSASSTSGGDDGAVPCTQSSGEATAALPPEAAEQPTPASSSATASCTPGGGDGDARGAAACPQSTGAATATRLTPDPSLSAANTRDFGHIIADKRRADGRSTRLDAKVVMAGLTTRWKPAKKEDFPQSHHKCKGRTISRRITENHLVNFPWLVISRHEEHWGAWCANCVIMGGNQAGGNWGIANQKLGRLVTRPLRDFSDLTGKTGILTNHHTTKYHQSNTTAVADFLHAEGQNKNVEEIITTASNREVERNRAALASIVDTIKFAAMQNIAIRGHRDDGRIESSGEYPVINDGNFRMLLRFRIQSGDTVLQEHLKCAAGSALYTSKTAQNELLQDIGQLVSEAVSKKVAASPVWAILADETTDRARREQMAVVVRYLDCVEGKHVVREDPIKLIDVFSQLGAVDSDEEEVKLSGENLAKVLLKVISSCHLNTANLIAQCYDGAAAMASAKVGVAKRLQDVAPLAHYYHCAMHGLNLSTSEINRVATVRNALGTMETVIVFVTDSAKRSVILQQAQKKAGLQQLRLIKLCQTRFVERHTSVQRFCDQFPAIVDALQMMSRWSDSKTSSKAATLLSAMATSEFLVGVVISKTLAGLLRPVSLKMQEAGGDLIQTLQLTRATMDTLMNLRNDEKAFDPLMAEAQAMGDELGTVLSKPRTTARSTCRANAGDADMDETCYYRINVMLPAVDAVRHDMETRFGSDKPPADTTGAAIQARHGSHHPQAFALSHILPRRVTGATWQDVRPGWELFQSVLPTLNESLAKAEFLVWAAMWSRNTDTPPVTAAAALDHCSSASFPIIYRLLQVLAVLPVSSAEAERLFSKVERTLTAIRATMGEERLEALILCQAHREALPSTREVVDYFAKSGARRAKLSALL